MEKRISDILEQGLQRVLNGVGQTIITEAIERFDTEGEPILLGSIAMTSNGRFPECYKSLFGPIELRRHTYQSSEGGRTFCPLEQSARICATLGLCQILAAKHVSLSGRCLQRELKHSHQLDFNLGYLQDVTQEFGKRALGKEDH